MSSSTLNSTQDVILREVLALRDEVRDLRSLIHLGRRKYTIEEAAERLKVSDRTVRRRISDGELALSREGGRVFVTESAVRDYEDRCRRAA